MSIHREGYAIIGISIAVITVLIALANRYLPDFWGGFLTGGLVVLAVLIVQFFRNPRRVIAQIDNALVYAPADGKVVVIEEAEESEYFQDKRLQVSIFMSPLNVHVNRNPVSGLVKYTKYHPGKYLVAWHPKSSTENERTTVVYDTGKTEILVRQIAGAVARRIINYLKVGEEVKQGGEMGFIRFGSRVDLFLPLDSEVQVKIGQTVKGNVDIIAKLS